MKLRRAIGSALPAAWRERISRAREWRSLPPAARAEIRADRQGIPLADPGPGTAIEANLDWLARAQDRSPTADGGVARHYSLLTGWGASYPETTGYIVPTLLDLAADPARPDRQQLVTRARRMLDWLVAIQLPDGAFQGGTIVQRPVRATTFNTGQILLGLAAGARQLGDARYHEAMHRAAGWLVATQDPDGCWRRHPSPFTKPGEKAYETHVAWGLFEADRVGPGRGDGEAGLKHVRWALTKQGENGWFADCDLEDPAAPLTHTLGYVVRGIIEAHRWRPDPALLAAARRTADALMAASDGEGRLMGRLDRSWRPTVDWLCLTGLAQIACCWLLLFELTGATPYRAAGRRANALVRRTLHLTGDDGRRGGVKGSFPVDGRYGRFEYLNWAAKFSIDANVLELRLANAR